MAVFIKNCFGPEWIRKLKKGLEKNLNAPSQYGRVWDCDVEGRSCFYDSQVWLDICEYKQFALKSHCGEIAGRLMGSSISTSFSMLFLSGHREYITVRHFIRMSLTGPSRVLTLVRCGCLWSRLRKRAPRGTQESGVVEQKLNHNASIKQNA